MKKSSILLSLVLVFALSLGAAAQFSLSGFFEFDTGLYQPWDAEKEEHGPLTFFGQARRGFTLKYTLTQKQSGSLKAIASWSNAAATSSQGANNWHNWTNPGSTDPGNAPVGLNPSSFRIEATGALWKGGQSVTFTAGNTSVNYHPWVASSSARRLHHPNADTADSLTPLMNAVKIEGFEVGPLTLNAAHGYGYQQSEDEDEWNRKWGQDEATFIQAKGNISGLDLTAVAVNRQVISDAGENAERETVWDLATEVKVKPTDGVELTGIVAVDGQGQGRNGKDGDEVAPKLAYQVDAKVTTIPNLTLNGSVWMAEDGFAPRYAQWDKKATDNEGNKEKGNHVPFKTDRQGFKVSAETTQAGVKLNGGFESVTNVSGAKYELQKITGGASTTIEGFDLSASVTLSEETRTSTTNKSETVLGVGTDLAGVTVNYKGTISKTDKEDAKMKNEITAKKTVDLFFADKVTLNAAVIHNAIDGPKDAEGNVKLEYGIDASWEAPNGLNFVVGYANYNKSGNNFVNKKNPDGFYIRTHAKVDF